MAGCTGRPELLKESLEIVHVGPLRRSALVSSHGSFDVCH